MIHQIGICAGKSAKSEKTRHIQFAACITIALLLAGCNSYLHPKPDVLPQPHKANLAVSLQMDMPLIMHIASVQVPIQKIYLAKFGDNGNPQHELISSNFVSGYRSNRAYFLNIDPGTYSLVATRNCGKGSVFVPVSGCNTVYFPKEMFEVSKMSIKEGDFVFMGSYFVHAPIHFDLVT